MKYKGREVIDFSIMVELGNEFKGDFKNNQSYVARVLARKNVDNWIGVESVIDDLVIITPKENNLTSVNELFKTVSNFFEKVSIHVLYNDFDSNGHNLEEFPQELNADLFQR